MPVRTIEAELGRHRAEMALLVAGLKARVMAGPENPRMRRLSRNCGVVRSSDLGASWSAEHHDFGRQYEAVCGAVDKAGMDRAAKVVEEAAASGALRMKGWTMKLHPDVVEHLKGVLA